MQIKIAINTCYGGFGISKKANRWIREHHPECPHHDIEDEPSGFSSDTTVQYNGKYYRDRHAGMAKFSDLDVRSCPALIAAIEALGEEASGECADLEVEEINLDINIEDHDGKERVTYGRSW